MQRTRQAHFGMVKPWDLAQIVTVPPHAHEGTWKGRLTYDDTIKKVEFEPYVPRLVKTLRLVKHDTIDYRFKYQNRQAINELYAQRGDADDVLIVKNKLLTDTSYANIAFWDGTRWLTPTSPLLEGTKRAQLLQEGKIQAMPLRPSDVSQFAYACLINAMLVFEETPVILIDNII